jgi:hypothetical protein
MSDINYRYNEDKLVEEIKKYIDETYSQHYSQNKFQATEFIIDSGHGLGFTVGNVMKYAQRYGKKDGRNRQDIMKVIHYAIMMLYVHDFETNAEKQAEKDFAELHIDYLNRVAEEYKKQLEQAPKPLTPLKPYISPYNQQTNPIPSGDWPFGPPVTATQVVQIQKSRIDDHILDSIVDDLVNPLTQQKRA